jgi:hypothetical protein
MKTSGNRSVLVRAIQITKFSAQLRNGTRLVHVLPGKCSKRSKTMKPVRLISLVIAIGLFVTAFTPVASLQKTASPNQNTITVGAPPQSFVEAALGSPMTLLAGAPVISVSIDAMPAGANYSCSLMNQSPANWTRMGRRQYFDAKWTVKNTGTKIWHTSGFDLRYISGTKMHTNGDAYDLNKTTGPGKKVTVLADMTAPKNNGYYTAYWGLFQGNTVFCRLSITINVNRQ